ncbi:Cdc37 N terminal kinase binding-domain-containing protein [Sparassis latifolia]
MPLNYSKWDALELSDDSDIEGHPNVDKRSLIRWKQRDIHEKREERKHRIALLEADIACNAVLQPRLRTIADEVASKGPAHFSALVERFKTEPSPERPPTNAPEQQTYDEMLLNLMLTIWEEVKKAGIDKDDARLGELLVQGLEKHFVQMGEHQGKQKQELAQLQEDNKRKITSDDIHVGFDSHYVPPKPEPSPIKGAIEPSKPKKTTEYEVLNPKGVEGTTTTSVPAASSTVASDDELPELTPSLEQFSHLPLRGYQQSWDFIRSHRDVYVAGASDALLVAAFKAQNDGKAVYAQQCVHQSLLIQYCEKLGPDGVTLFFRKMVVADPRASSVFENDVAQTYAHLAERVRISKAEEAAVAGEEQIQLVAENPSQSISFNIPDGPPPEHLQLEGPGFEDVNIEDVRKALQMRWDVFQGFSEAMQEALKSQELDKVNKVLGSMSVKEAEDVVQLLDLGGILNFSSGGIRDETGEEGEGVEEQEVEQ